MLNEGLWIDTTFAPCQISLDYPFKQFFEVAYFGSAPIVRDHTVPPSPIYPTACPTTYVQHFGHQTNGTLSQHFGIVDPWTRQVGCSVSWITIPSFNRDIFKEYIQPKPRRVSGRKIHWKN
jgi:hypothetical protein